ncbi:cation-transporting P-type ATPase [Rhodopseudomonas pseudopalustris]|uniref:cation-transporting P-type ATPase n=1 Tax=Rhodopseudomonas pseudopalustris TaxID=1513892 RepID=UPI0015881FB8|nr:cation-transporting P-type ATPase [Rhodopseudomonas pseudopalustris]
MKDQAQFWLSSIDALLAESNSQRTGLTSGEAAQRLLRYGHNAFHQPIRQALLAVGAAPIGGCRHRAGDRPAADGVRMVDRGRGALALGAIVVCYLACAEIAKRLVLKRVDVINSPADVCRAIFPEDRDPFPGRSCISAPARRSGRSARSGAG